VWRVASVPAFHVYVRDLANPAGFDAVRRLSDPEPADSRTVPGRNTGFCAIGLNLACPPSEAPDRV